METMTSKQRMITAIERGVPDRLPVTTHHVMPYFLDRYMPGTTTQEFFDIFGFDPITWVTPHTCEPNSDEYLDPEQREIGFLESNRVSTDNWRISIEDLPDPEYQTLRYTIRTPKGNLTTVLQTNSYTSWVVEHLVKEKKDIEIIGEYVTAPKCNVAEVNKAADEFGERGLVRGHIACFDIFGQPGTWQDACCLYGTQEMIMATYDDPAWVHEFLTILRKRKEVYVRSLKGAKYDILELGGGSASSTVISPRLFEQFVAPYDSVLIKLAHEAGQRIAYHTCGGMMPLLEMIAAMGPDVSETLTPPGMGADVNLAEVKRRIGDKVALIGGFDQFHFFVGCTEAETRAEVRRLFEAAGGNGGYLLSPSDHFFDADLNLIRAFVDEARQCVYEAQAV